MSKAAAHMAGVTLAADLREAGVVVAIIHPGAFVHGAVAALSDARSLRICSHLPTL